MGWHAVKLNQSELKNKLTQNDNPDFDQAVPHAVSKILVEWNVS